MAQVLTSISGAVISAASAGYATNAGSANSAGYAPTNANEVEGIVSTALSAELSGMDSSYVNYSAIGLNGESAIISIGGSAIAGGGGSTATGEYVPLTATNATIGTLNTASDTAFAQGASNSASYSSIAQGSATTAISASLAIGKSASASVGSIALGGAIASEGGIATNGIFSSTPSTAHAGLAIGYSGSAASADRGIAIAGTAIEDSIAIKGSASGYAVAIGGTADPYSIAIGNVASAHYKSTSLGWANTADYTGFAAGQYLSAKDRTAFGKYNQYSYSYSDPRSAVENNSTPIFVIGNGTANSARSNILEVYSGGDLRVFPSAQGSQSMANGISITAMNKALTGKQDSSAMSAYVNYSSIGTDSASAITSIGGSSIAGGGGGGGDTSNCVQSEWTASGTSTFSEWDEINNVEYRATANCYTSNAVYTDMTGLHIVQTTSVDTANITGDQEVFTSTAVGKYGRELGRKNELIFDFYGSISSYTTATSLMTGATSVNTSGGLSYYNVVQNLISRGYNLNEYILYSPRAEIDGNYLFSTSISRVSFNQEMMYGSGTAYLNSYALGSESQPPMIMSMNGIVDPYNIIDGTALNWPSIVITTENDDISSLHFNIGHMSENNYNLNWVNYGYDPTAFTAIDSSLSGTGTFVIPAPKLWEAVGWGTVTSNQWGETYWQPSATMPKTQEIAYQISDFWDSSYAGMLELRSNKPGRIPIVGLACSYGELHLPS